MIRVLTAALLAAFFVLPAKADDALVSIFENASRSVGALYEKEDGGNMSFLCSVTAVDKHEGATVFLTAYHCVKRGISYSITLDGKSWEPARVWKIPGYEIDKRKYARAWHDPETDMALFLADGFDVPLISLSNAAGQKPGSGVVMIGFPLGVAKIAYQGIVSGYFNRPGAEQDGYQLLQIFGAPGSSGSAVIDVASGKVVSVLVSAKQSRAGLPVIFATPIEYQRYLREVPMGMETSVGAHAGYNAPLARHAFINECQAIVDAVAGHR